MYRNRRITDEEVEINQLVDEMLDLAAPRRPIPQPPAARIVSPPWMVIRGRLSTARSNIRAAINLLDSGVARPGINIGLENMPFSDRLRAAEDNICALVDFLRGRIRGPLPQGQADFVRILNTLARDIRAVRSGETPMGRVRLSLQTAYDVIQDNLLRRLRSYF